MTNPGVYIAAIDDSPVPVPLGATYRMWARNWDYSLRQPVWKWVTMDLSLKYCDISTCILTMQTSDYLETWYGGGTNIARGTPYEAACQVKFADWPTSGTTITNEGSGAAAYNGTAGDNDYLLLPSGATSFVFNDTTDTITIPHGAAVDNLLNITFEFIIYHISSAHNQVLYDRVSGPNENCVYIKPDDTLVVLAGNTTDSNSDTWATASKLTGNAWNTIQVTWALGTGPGNAPSVYINNTYDAAVSHTTTGTGTWNSLAVDILLGKYVSLTSLTFTGTLCLFRLHNAVLTDAQLTQNYNADKWRYLNSPATVTPVTERTWIQNHTCFAGDADYDASHRYKRGTGIVIYRNDDENPIFNGMITGFKSHEISDGEDTCEITFSSDEQLLLEHVAFPDILPGDGQYSGRVLPTSSTGIWGSTSGHSTYGSQWGTDYAALKDSQEAQMKYFVGDQIGAGAPATGTTNRKLSVLKVQDPWNYQDVNNVGYGDATLLTDILESLLDLCKYCVVPQPASDSTVFSPRDEIQFFVRYLNPPVGAYYLEFCTQTATDATYRAAYAARFSGGGHNHADVGMGTHDKRETCVFSMQTGTVTEMEYEELRPEVNQLFVIGPTPADTSNVTTTALLATSGHGSHHGYIPDVQGDQEDPAVMGAASAQAAQDVSVTTDIDRRMYKTVTGEPVTLSQDVYGVIESTFEHSTGEGMPTIEDTSKSETLKMMKFSGRSELNERLFNIYYKATVRENDVLKMSPDEGMQNFFIGDYVSVITQYGTIQNLVREIHLSTDSNGEKLETIVGTPAAAYGNWWTAGNVAKRSRHHGHRTSRHHSHNTKSQT